MTLLSQGMTDFVLPNLYTANLYQESLSIHLIIPVKSFKVNKQGSAPL